MAESHVVSGLVAKRGEVAGEVMDLEATLKSKRHLLASIDATIKAFAPELKPHTIAPKRAYKRTGYYAPGELPRFVSECLRTADGPITVLQIATRFTQDHGKSFDNAPVFDRVKKRVSEIIRQMRVLGKVHRYGTTRDSSWALIQD